MKNKNLCAERGCLHERAPGRRLCHKHRIARWRKKNPIKASYLNIRHNARRKGTPFTISFEYFKKFARRVDLVYGVNNTREGWTVDRKKVWLGYVPGNLAWLPRCENSAKGVREHLTLEYSWRDKTGRFIKRPDVTDKSVESENPF